MPDRTRGLSRDRRARTVAPWISLAILGVGLLVIGARLWQLPWANEAIVIGQVWTPQIAIVAVIVGLTLLAACLVRGVNAAWTRYQHLSWSFELATLTIVGVAVVWLGLVGLTSLGFIPADAHFSETVVDGRTIVVRTTRLLDDTTSAEGVRSGLLVRWSLDSESHRRTP